MEAVSDSDFIYPLSARYGLVPFTYVLHFFNFTVTLESKYVFWGYDNVDSSLAFFFQRTF